jgi:5-methylcytosine-specific restriction enzyme subunit McrC
VPSGATRRIELEEEADLFLTKTQLNDSQALSLYKNPCFDLEWPNPGNNFNFKLRSKGWVGHFPVGDGVIVVKPKVPIASIFGMLEVAYKLKSFKIGEGEIAVQSLEDVYQHIASILAQRVNNRWRKGLYRTYVVRSEDLQWMRGRIDIRQNIRNVAAASPRLYCHYEELTADVDENAVLLWALHVASRLHLSREEVRQQVRRAYRNLAGDVSLQPKTAHDCVGRLYSRLNDDYEPMHGLCRFLIEHTGPSIDIGSHKFLPFSIDMVKLFELFVAEFLAQKLPTNLKIDIQYHARLSANADLTFRIDLVVRDRMSGKPLSVIDTKYKINGQPAESDIQQVVAYAVQLGVSRAYLIYPFEIEQPIKVEVGGIRVSTLGIDLSSPLEHIWKTLIPLTVQ